MHGKRMFEEHALYIFVWCNLKNCDTIYLRVTKEHRHE